MSGIDTNPICWQASCNSGPLDAASTAPWIRDLIEWIEIKRRSFLSPDVEVASDEMTVTFVFVNARFDH
jgi:hypothetical protein